MKFFDWMMDRVRNFNMFDMALFKTTVAVAGIIIGAYIATFVKTNIAAFAAVFVILYAFLWYRMLTQK